MKTYTLIHPIHGCAATADQIGYYRHNGRFVGLDLQFPDGHRVKLTYAEIGELQAGVEETAVTEPAPQMPAVAR